MKCVSCKKEVSSEDVMICGYCGNALCPECVKAHGLDCNRCGGELSYLN